MSDFAFASLMDLATLDTSELQAQTSRLQTKGIYILALEDLKFVEQPASDPAEPMNYILNIKGMCMGFEPLDKDAAPVEMEGKSISERYFIYGKDLRQAIQLLMGRYKTVGFRHKGIMGGVEGSEPGWIDDAMGKMVVLRVNHYTPKDGQERAQYDWLSPKMMAKAGIPWETLQREFHDEVGNPVEVAA
jgi:hypothetical protein